MGTVVLFVVVAALVGAAAVVSLGLGGGRDAADRRAIAAHRATMQRLADAVVGPPVSLANPPTGRTTPAGPSRRRRLQVLGAGLALAAAATALARLPEGETTPPAAPPQTTTEAPPGTTTTTLPPTTALTPTSANPREIVYSARAAEAILIVAHGRCWVSARRADGTTGFEGTLEPGDRRRIDGAWPLRLRLGSPTSVSVFVGDTPAKVPAKPGQPVNLTFTPA